MSGAVQCVWPMGAELGEGPIWSAREQSLWFVDIKRQRIYRYRPATHGMQSWQVPGQVSFLAPVSGGGFIAGLETGLHQFNPQDGELTLLTAVEAPELGNRLNDAHVDAAGRLWFGSMHDGEQNLSGALYSFCSARKLRRHDAGYCITNGPATSPDGRTLYHTDTLQRVIYAFDVSPAGELSNKREWVRIHRAGAWPDGPVVDAEGCVWTGLFGGWGLQRYSPRGDLLERIDLPCANVTKAAFGGDDRRTLYVTTARKGLTAAELTAQPLAGGLFAVRVDIAGLPQQEVRLD